MVHHSVIISDIHLCEAVAGDGLWMRYRQKRFFPDADFTSLFSYLRARAESGKIEIILNGDIFDFDAPVAIHGEIVFEDQPRTESVAVDRLRQMLDDHEEFLCALGGMIAAGHRVIFISGNHDVQLVFPAVRSLLIERLVSTAQTQNAGMTESDLRARILFRTWFYQTPTGIHVEHGNQYDWLCSFRDPMHPFIQNRAHIQPNMGSLSFRHLVSRMGYFNPYVDDSFMLSLPQYLMHWVRYYLFTKRGFCWTWICGAVKTFVSTWWHRSRPSAKGEEKMVVACQGETGVGRERIHAHAALFAPPSDNLLFFVLRQLWLDRLLLFVMAIVVTIIVWIFGSTNLALFVLVFFAFGVFVYECVAPDPFSLRQTYDHITQCARRIAKLHQVRAVIFGHTHIPYGTWEEGIFFGNSGTWSSSFRDVACTIPVAADGRPVIWLYGAEDAPLQGGLYLWKEGALTS